MLRLLTSLFGFLLILFTTAAVFAAPCGNGVCQASQDETCSSCPADCGACPTPTPAPTSPPTPVPTSTPAPTSNPTPIPTATASPSSNPTSGPTPSSTPAPSETGTSSNNSSDTAQSPASFPRISLNLPQNPTSQNQLNIGGNASIEQGSLAGAEYSLDNGATWNQISAADSSFNSANENLALSLNQKEGKYTIKARAKSQSGVYTQTSSYFTGSFTIITTPPGVVLDKLSPNPAKTSIIHLSGSANSVIGNIRIVEVTINNRKSWYRARISGRRFSLTLPQLEDGNYPVEVRAIDNAGNIGYSEIQTLIIDTIPPVIGGMTFSLGPQFLTPSNKGTLEVVSNTRNTILLSIRGGATETTIEAEGDGFKLSPIKGTDLWTGDIVFSSAGKKIPQIISTDGAGNQTRKIMNPFIVKNSGMVLNSRDYTEINNAEVSVFYFDPTSKRWSLWDAAPFGQQNPQKTNSSGNFSFMVPAGRYYAQVKAVGFRTQQSEILNLTQTSDLNFTFRLIPTSKITFPIPFLGSVTLGTFQIFPPQVLPQQALITPEVKTDSSQLAAFSNAPAFSLPSLNNQIINLSQYKGKKLLLSFISGWSAESKEQAKILSDLSAALPSNNNLLVVFLQQSEESVNAFMQRGNYKFAAAFDRDGLLTSKYPISLLPAHFFIDSKGKIQNLHTGTLTKEEFLARLNLLP